jgi:hypothetical protein
VFCLNVSGPTGVAAEFTVPSATLALDLALRSERAGLIWWAELRGGDEVQRLSLSGLRQAAQERAQDDDERRLLDEVEWQHELQSSFGLN